MTLRQIVMELIARGHKVNYYVRKDGGLVIHSIDGTHYSGNTGNAVARKMLGVALSTRRKVQLERINTQRNWKKSQTPIPEDLEKYRLKVNRLLRKNVEVGTISRRNLRAKIEEEGIEGARRYLEEMERSARSQIPHSMLYSFYARIEADIENELGKGHYEDVKNLQEVEDLVKANEDTMDFYDFETTLRMLYEWEEGHITSYELLRDTQSRVRNK